MNLCPYIYNDIAIDIAVCTTGNAFVSIILFIYYKLPSVVLHHHIVLYYMLQYYVCYMYFHYPPPK